VDLKKRNDKEWATLGIKGYVMLMIEFLRFSPSYEFARRVHVQKPSDEEWQKVWFSMYQKERKEELTDEEKNWLIDDFKLVQKTFEEYGDITHVTQRNFDHWWIERGMDIYAVEHQKPRVWTILKLENKTVPEDEKVVNDEDKGEEEDKGELFQKRMNRYLKTAYKREGEPPALILTVPLGVDKKQTLSQIAKLIEKANVPVLPIAKKAKRELTAQRLRSKPLFAALHLLMGKSMAPKLVLWRLGVRTKVSPKNAVGLDPTLNLTTQNVDKANRMAILTSRALKRAKLLTENAARGLFPCADDRMMPYFNYSAIYKRMQAARPDKLKTGQIKTKK